MGAVSLLLTTNAGAQNGGSVADNFFISAGAGVNSTVFNPVEPGNLGFAAELNAGTWFSRMVGARIGYNGGWNNSKQEMDVQSISADKPFGFHYLHADLLYSFSNDIGGRNPDRLWDVAFYVNTGALKVSKSRTPFTQGKTVWTGGIGMINELKVSKKASITLDLQAVMADASDYSSSGIWFGLFPIGTIGLTFYLGDVE